VRFPRENGACFESSGSSRYHKPGRTRADTDQIYTDWVYLWWMGYAADMHGHLYIILKDSLRWIPILGTGMMLFGFIFLSRKWATDQKRFQHRLQKLSTSHTGPLSGSKRLDPMWLLIFPEGTNLSTNGRAASKRWADMLCCHGVQACRFVCKS
jgi:1-acyl-sn-glycerol-3-phosphate acyltransferase